MSAWAIASPRDRLRVRVGQPHALVAVGLGDLRLALERGLLLADLLVAVEFGDADRLLPLRFLDERFLFEQRRLLADLALLVELRRP